MIHCSNPLCQEPNPLTHRHCQYCGRPLTHRYLWALGDWIKAYQVGEVLEERYLLIAPQIVLDLQPDSTTYSPTDIPHSILPYLRLLPYRRHIPQVHSYIPSQEARLNLDIWLLDYGSLPLDEQGQLRYPQLLPAIADCWSQVSARQQLQWLWQIAALWEPLAQQGVVASLLDPSLLRINDKAVQLLELIPDFVAPGGLPQLGEVWSSWIESSDPSLVPFLRSLCQDLRSQRIDHPQTLLSLLDAAIQTIQSAYTQRYRLFSATDVGLMRDHNEDACYPPTETTLEVNAPTPLLTMVCDGIGGQEGGEIAAHLTIENLKSEIEPHLQAPDSPNDLPTDSPSANNLDWTRFLEQAIRKTNDLICDRNNAEARQERQRMGTTLVLSLFQGGKLYLAHVGDSRLYWITANSCQQVTVDDDWASKEVRLGYSFYRDAIQYPRSGSLVQAIGISESLLLTPTVQSCILDENCVILLCSDGLSDYDRVEQYGQSLIAPILAGTTDVATVGQQLITLANELNGHDNITLALIHCQAWLPPNQPLPILDYEQLFAALPASLSSSTPTAYPQDFFQNTSQNTSQNTAQPLPPPLPHSPTPPPLTPEATDVPPPRPTARFVAIAVGLIIAAIAAMPHLLKFASSPGDSPHSPVSFPSLPATNNR